MADNRLDEAIDIVARYILHARRDVMRTGLGLADQDAVIARIKEIAPIPSLDEYHAALEYLVWRDKGDA